MRHICLEDYFNGVGILLVFWVAFGWLVDRGAFDSNSDHSLVFLNWFTDSQQIN